MRCIMIQVACYKCYRALKIQEDGYPFIDVPEATLFIFDWLRGWACGCPVPRITRDSVPEMLPPPRRRLRVIEGGKS